MFLIAWRNRSRVFNVTCGLSRYSKEGAERQVGIWQKLFPRNSYYIIPAR